MFVEIVVRGNCWPYRDIFKDTYNLYWNKQRKCYTGKAEYFTTRNEADIKGSEWVMSQHTKGNHNTTGCTDQNLDATGDNGSEPIPCDDSNASVLADGSCGPCNTGYLLENDICTDSDDIADDDEDDTGGLKYILWGGGHYWAY